MADIKLDWTEFNATKVEIEVDRLIRVNLLRAILFFHSQLREVISEANPRPYNDSSKAGEPPRRRTGNLGDNVVWEVDDIGAKEMAGRVGITPNAIYGIWLELGTSKMRPRPWIRSTWERYQGEIRTLITGGQG